MLENLIAPRGHPVKTVLFTITLSITNYFFLAYSLAYTNTAATTVIAFLNDSYIARHGSDGARLNDDELTWYFSLLLNLPKIGAALGTIAAPWFCEGLGRNRTMLWTNATMVLLAALGVAAVWLRIPELMLVSRVLGVTVNYVNIPALVAFTIEFGPTRLNDINNFCSHQAFGVVLALGQVLGMDVLLGQRLDLLLAVPMLVAFIGVLLSAVTPESAKFLLLKRGDFEGARRSLQFYHPSKQRKQGCDDVDSFDATLNEILRERDIRTTAAEQQQQQDPLCIRLGQLFTTRHLLKAFIIGVCVLQMVLGLAPFTTILLSDHFSKEVAQFLATCNTVLTLVIAPLGAWAVHHFGTRPMLLATGITHAAAISLFIAADLVAQSNFVLSSFAAYGCVLAGLLEHVSYGMGLGAIPFYLSSALLPQHFRSLGQSVVFFVAMWPQFALDILALPAYHRWGVLAFAPLYVLPNILCVVVVWLLLPEINGRETHEIVHELKRSRRHTIKPALVIADASRY